MASPSAVYKDYVKVDTAFALPPPKPTSKRTQITGSTVGSRYTARLFTGGEKRLSFASEWYFTPDGVRTIERQFAAAKGQPVSFFYAPKNLLVGYLLIAFDFGQSILFPSDIYSAEPFGVGYTCEKPGLDYVVFV